MPPALATVADGPPPSVARPRPRSRAPRRGGRSSTRCGRSGPTSWLEAWAADLADDDREPAYRVAVGVVAARAGVPLAATVAAYLQALAAGLVSAAVRLVPLGQTDGQRALAALEPVILAAGEAALGRPLAAIGSATPMVESCSMRHETQHTRLFRS